MSPSLESRLQDWMKNRGLALKEYRFTLRRVGKSPLSIIGLSIIVFFVFMAVLAPQLAPPYPEWNISPVPDPFVIPQVSNTVAPTPPTTGHPFGLTVDQYDIYYGCIWGTITAFRVGAYVVIISLMIGLTIGLVAGYYGGVIDEVLMRFTDIVMAFPGLILALALTIALPNALSFSLLILFMPLAALFVILAAANILTHPRERGERLQKRGLTYVVFALVSCVIVTAIFSGYVPDVTVFGITLARLDKILFALILVGWPGYARVIRGEVLRVRNEDYVEAAKAIGCSDSRIILKHIAPNTIYPIIILASLDVGSVVLMAAGLSFIGLGSNPNYADWGQLVEKAQTYMGGGSSLILYWYIWLIPGAFIFAFSLGWNLLGDALRDILDPTLRRR